MWSYDEAELINILLSLEVSAHILIHTISRKVLKLLYVSENCREMTLNCSVAYDVCANAQIRCSLVMVHHRCEATSFFFQRAALESCRSAWGACVIVGWTELAELTLAPYDLLLGRTLKGTYFGGEGFFSAVQICSTCY